MSSRQKIEENTTGRKYVAFFRIRANFVSIRLGENLRCHPEWGFIVNAPGRIGKFSEAKIRPFHNNRRRQRYEDVFRFDFTIDESLGMDIVKSPGQLGKNLYMWWHRASIILIEISLKRSVTQFQYEKPKRNLNVIKNRQEWITLNAYTWKNDFPQYESVWRHSRGQVRLSEHSVSSLLLRRLEFV